MDMTLTDEELNRWLAEKVMGWVKVDGDFWLDNIKGQRVTFKPTKDHNHAQMVLEEIEGFSNRCYIVMKIVKAQGIVLTDSFDAFSWVGVYQLMATPARQKMEAVYEVLYGASGEVS